MYWHQQVILILNEFIYKLEHIVFILFEIWLVNGLFYNDMASYTIDNHINRQN